MSLSERLAVVLGDLMVTEREPDGALTVHHDGTVASLRVVALAEDLELVSLTQVLAWDLPLTADLRDTVAEQARHIMLGTVSLTTDTERTGEETADVLLRYNFPAGTLTDEALRTMLMLVLAGGADVRRALVG